MASVKVLAFLAMACMASIAQGSLFVNDHQLEAVRQQRSLLQSSPAPAVYSNKNQAIKGRIALLVRGPKGKTVTASLGAAFLVKRLKSVQTKFNKDFKASNNIAVVYVSGPKTFKGQAWVYFDVTAGIGPVGASYSAALKGALRRIIRPTSTYVKVIRGNLN